MESLLRDAGECGKFQARHVFFTQLPRFVTVWAVFLMMFGSYDPGWKCVVRHKVKDDGGGFREAETSNNSDSSTDGGVFRGAVLRGLINSSLPSSLSSSKTYEAFQKASPELLRLNETTRRALKKDDDDDDDDDYNNSDRQYDASKNNNNNNNNNITKEEEYNGECRSYDTCEDVEFNPASSTVVSRFQLVCDRAWIVKCIFLLQGVGYFIGALVGGQIGEKFGRKIGLYSSTVILCLSSGLAIFSPHWSVYAVCIFFLGLGANGVISLTSVFSVEFLNSKWRGYFGSIPTWNVSLLIFTLTISVLKNWIYLHVITFIMSLISCVGFIVVVESPRWLMMNGRPKEAEDAIRKIARINGRPPPNSDRLLHLKTDQRIGDEGETTTSVGRKSYTYLDLFRTKEIRTRALKLGLVMGIFGIVYYAFGWGVQSLPGNFYVNAVVSSIIEIVNLLMVGPLCNRTGRRKAGVFMALVGTVSCFSIVVALFAAEEGGTIQATVIKAFAFVGKAASQAIFSITSLFIVELLPTVVRNVGIGFCRCLAGLGTLLAPFLIPSSDVISFAVCFALLCVCYVIQIGIFLSLPETNNLDLLDGLVQDNADINKEISVADPSPEQIILNDEKDEKEESKSISV